VYLLIYWLFTRPYKPEALVFPESALAHALLDGLEGVEIGASAHNPFGLNTINVDFTNSSEMVFKRKEKDLSGGRTVAVDVVAEGDRLPFANDSYDFVINSHVVEHFYDPIGAVEEWLRVVRPGGLVFMIIPHKERTKDARKPVTPAETLQARHTLNPEMKEVLMLQPRRTHQAVWVRDTFVELCQRVGWRVIASQEVDDKVGNGFTVVIQKPYC